MPASFRTRRPTGDWRRRARASRPRDRPRSICSMMCSNSWPKNSAYSVVVSGTGIVTDASRAREEKRRIVVRAVPRVVVLPAITGMTLTCTYSRRRSARTDRRTSGTPPESPRRRARAPERPECSKARHAPQPAGEDEAAVAAESAVCARSILCGGNGIERHAGGRQQKARDQNSTREVGPSHRRPSLEFETNDGLDRARRAPDACLALSARRN